MALHDRDVKQYNGEVKFAIFRALSTSSRWSLTPILFGFATATGWKMVEFTRPPSLSVHLIS
jgi:hypothetical protein